jgi:hypothetical protein
MRAWHQQLEIKCLAKGLRAPFQHGLTYRGAFRARLRKFCLETAEDEA